METFSINRTTKFSRQENAELRWRIYKLADSGNGILGLEQTIAFTASGKKEGLQACDDALAIWDGRQARRDHRTHEILR